MGKVYSVHFAPADLEGCSEVVADMDGLKLLPHARQTSGITTVHIVADDEDRFHAFLDLLLSTDWTYIRIELRR